MHAAFIQLSPCQCALSRCLPSLHSPHSLADTSHPATLSGPISLSAAGYFTSRPALKGYIRATSAYQQAARQLQMWTGGAANMETGNPLYLLERAQSVAQHHDAVSGTSKQAVAYGASMLSCSHAIMQSCTSRAQGPLAAAQRTHCVSARSCTSV